MDNSKITAIDLYSFQGSTIHLYAECILNICIFTIVKPNKLLLQNPLMLASGSVIGQESCLAVACID